VLALAIIADIGANLAVIAGAFYGSLEKPLAALQQATYGFINPMLPNAMFMLGVVLLVVFGFGRLRPADVGWRVAALPWAVLFLVGFWVALRGVMAAEVSLSGASFRWHDDWRQRGVGYVLGYSLAQLLGIAFHEETVFRGFLLLQLCHKASALSRSRIALASAVVASAVVFAIAHLPGRTFVDELSGADLVVDQAWLVFFGLTFAAVFLLTGNLFIAIGLHALKAGATPLMQVSPAQSNTAWLLLALMVLATLVAAMMIRIRRTRSGEDHAALKRVRLTNG
jgi:membrane protease YdiL (CAAX protease family)